MGGEKGSYKRISEQIAGEYGSWLAGEVLPGERVLAEKYSTTRSVIQHAMKELERQGFVRRVRGKGTFINQTKKDFMNISGATEQRNKGISALFRSYGIKVSNTVLVSGTITGNRFLESRLKLQEGEPVFAIHRVRYGNEEPVAIEYTYIPKTLFPDIDSIDFNMVSLYEYMDARGHLPEKFDRIIRVMRLAPKEARYLELPVDAPAFYFELTGVDAERRIVGYTESFFRCDKTEFKFSSSVRQ